VFIEFFAEQAQRGGRLGLHHDGLIVHFHDGTLSNGRTSVAQAVGHKPMKEAEFKNQRAK